jgi:myo-inositol-1(or 4)-monophosphatase
MKEDQHARFIKKIIVKAGKETLKYYGKKNFAYHKGGENNIVTYADLASNKIIIDAIKKNFPSHGIISEEEKDYQRNAEYVWVVDPIDGTRNFANEIPLYAVMIALLRNNVVIKASIYLPYFKELYYAELGNGAYKNNVRIYCSNKKSYKNSCGIFGASGLAKYQKVDKVITKGIVTHGAWVNDFGSLAVDAVYAAQGKFEWYIVTYSWPGMWDFIAPALILKESGCKVTGIDGKPWIIRDDLSIVAANPVLHKEIIRLIK